MRRTLAGVLIAIGSLLALCAPSLFAETVNVTIGVGDTILKVSGKTSPDAFVTISKDGTVIGTAIADNAGTYEQIFTAQESGLHQLQLYAHTNGGENTDTISLTANITEHSTTIVDVFLPSTLAIEDTALEPDQSLILTGEALPNSIVSLYIDNTIYTNTPTDSQGRWRMAVSTSSFTAGHHTVFVRVTDSMGNQSYPTAARHFTIAEKVEPSPLAPSNPQKSRPHIPRPVFPKPGAQTPQANQEPLRIYVPQPRISTYAGEPFRLRAIVLNSQPPYDITVDWDTDQKAFLTANSNELIFEGTYPEAGIYNITAAVQDARGRKSSIYFAVDVLPRESNTSQDSTLFILILLVLLALYLSRKKSRRPSTEKVKSL